MRKHSKGMKIIVTAEKDFRHYGTCVAIMLRFIFKAKVIEAINNRIKFFDGKRTFRVAVDGGVAIAAVFE